MNWLIKLLSRFTKPIEGNPNEWLERDWKWGYREFVCGSCRGIYKAEDNEFKILAVQNTKKNDNFDRVLQWFEKSCKRDGYRIAFLEIENPKLLEKLRGLGFKGNKEKMIKSYPHPTIDTSKH